MNRRNIWPERQSRYVQTNHSHTAGLRKRGVTEPQRVVSFGTERACRRTQVVEDRYGCRVAKQKSEGRSSDNPRASALVWLFLKTKAGEHWQFGHCSLHRNNSIHVVPSLKRNNELCVMVLVELLNTPGLSAAARPAGQRPARPSQDRSRPAGHRPTLQGSSSASAASVGKIFESQAAPGLEESLSSTGEMVIRPWPNLSDSCATATATRGSSWGHSTRGADPCFMRKTCT